MEGSARVPHLNIFCRSNVELRSAGHRRRSGRGPTQLELPRTFGYLAVTSFWGLVACVCFMLAFVTGISAPKTHVYLVFLCLGAIPFLMAVLRYRQAKQSKVRP